MAFPQRDDRQVPASANCALPGTCDRIFTAPIPARHAGRTDKHEGAERSVRAPGLLLNMNKPIRVIGISGHEDRPFTGLVSATYLKTSQTSAVLAGMCFSVWSTFPLTVPSGTLHW